MSTAIAPHTCHAERCPVEVSAAMFMCKPHWAMVPPPLREAIKATYRPGQEIDKAPSEEYLAVARAAIAEVAHKEARGGRRTPRSTGKPIQLALFET
jgi:hypothetical protein